MTFENVMIDFNLDYIPPLFNEIKTLSPLKGDSEQYKLPERLGLEILLFTK
jgi:hypothetical protein